MTQTINQPNLADFPVSQFYYSGVIGDLVIGQANGAVSNGTRRQLPVGTFVLNYAKDENGLYFAQVGISTGETFDVLASDLWPTWNRNNPVFQVTWLTSQIQVPAILFVNQKQSLPNSDVREVIQYVLMNN